MFGTVHSVFALNDCAFLVFTTNNRYEVWSVTYKDGNVEDANLRDLDQLYDLDEISAIARMGDSFELDINNMLGSQESLTSNSGTNMPENLTKIHRTFEMKQLFDDWRKKDGLVADDARREQILSSHHTFCISTKTGKLVVLDVGLFYDEQMTVRVSIQP